MKAEILSNLHFPLTANFKKELNKLIPIGIKEIYLSTFVMSWEGYGKYEYRLCLEIDNKMTVFRWETTDSESYDYWKGAERNKMIDDFEKRKILSLFEQYQDELNNIN